MIAVAAAVILTAVLQTAFMVTHRRNSRQRYRSRSRCPISDARIARMGGPILGGSTITIHPIKKDQPS